MENTLKVHVYTLYQIYVMLSKENTCFVTSSASYI